MNMQTDPCKFLNICEWMCVEWMTQEIWKYVQVIWIINKSVLAICRQVCHTKLCKTCLVIFSYN
jgi:hypothetical protein